MRTLVLITSDFPFGAGEPFLETEFPIISREFEHNIIFSRNAISNKQRDLPENIIIFRYSTTTTLGGFLYLPFQFFRNSSLISEIYCDEKKFRNEIHSSFSFRYKLFLLKKIIKAIQLRDFIKLRLKQLNIDSGIVFYSYWANSGAHAAAMLSYKNSIRITRAHGHDLYEERNRLSYLPLLKFLAEKLDSVFFISEHGKKYFIEKTGYLGPNLSVAYLGVKTPESVSFDLSDNEIFTIVSCSNLSALKRVDLIIESISRIKSDRKIRWVHFGDGPCRNILENLAETLFGSKENIRYEFKGQTPNCEIIKFYSRNKVDLFLNTSSSEGIPVSIMEAQSFGTPVIATDTGGVSELITPGAGFLLPVDFKPDDLAEKICLFLNLTEEDIKKIRIRAFESRKSKFDAHKNYREFIKKVNSIFESAFNKF
jgi:colanic acid/amylovoran biosynthesis glycosyltransferase